MVLNLLLMADLADHFSVIWTLGADAGVPNGVYRSADGGWKAFPLPMGSTEESQYKALVLSKIVDSPGDWFPQIAASPDAFPTLKELMMWNIVLVDDERGAFQCDRKDPDAPEVTEESQVLRYCKVAHYDDEYRDQGLLVHMGGIGAKTDKDYDRLINFVDHPWKYRVADSALDFEDLVGRRFMTSGHFDTTPTTEDPVELVIERTPNSRDEDISKKEGRKTRKSCSSASIAASLAKSFDGSESPPK
jgi:hypothetical protein